MRIGLPRIEQETVDVLIYDNLYCNRERLAPVMIEPVRARLRKEGQ